MTVLAGLGERDQHLFGPGPGDGTAICLGEGSREHRDGAGASTAAARFLWKGETTGVQSLQSHDVLDIKGIPQSVELLIA